MRDTRAMRAALTVAVIACLAAGTVTGLAENAGPGGARSSGTSRASAPMLRSSVPPSAQQVGISEPLVISAVGGILTTVNVTGKSGAPLSGTFSEDRTRWISGRLDYNVPYTVNATGMGAAGRPLNPLNTSFRTVRPNRMLDVDAFRPSDGQTVGMAMPISIYFNHPVRDKAAVERRLSVTTSVPTEGSFNWVADDQVNWRPEHFWQTGTKVTVRAQLRGVDAGSGTFGDDDESSGFTIGRSQEAVGDARAHTLTLIENGAVVRTMPASFGRAQYPTTSGMHVAFEKHLSKRMRSDSWGGPAEGEPGFYDETLPLAVRISGNGEFVHVNAATVGQQGRYNVSHGCVNLSPANGRAFYDWVQIGDPVNIIGSGRSLTPSEGDIADWLLPWEQYVTGSALRAPAPGAATKANQLITRITE